MWSFGSKECGILVLQPGIEPAPAALEGEVLTTGAPGMSLSIPLALSPSLCFLHFFFLWDLTLLSSKWILFQKLNTYFILPSNLSLFYL